MQNRPWAERPVRRAGQGSDPEGRPAPGRVRKLVLPDLLSCSHSAALAAGTQPCTECDRDQQAPLSAQGGGSRPSGAFHAAHAPAPRGRGLQGKAQAESEVTVTGSAPPPTLGPGWPRH